MATQIAEIKAAKLNSMGEGIIIKSPYNAYFVAALKGEIPSNSRQWICEHKAWFVVASEEELAIKIALRFYQVADSRVQTPAEVEEVKIAAEIGQIKENQRVILESDETYRQWSQKLTDKINRYSYGSKSSVRYAAAQLRALIDHALDNARKPVEQLVEIEVRGLAAAARLEWKDVARCL